MNDERMDIIKDHFDGEAGGWDERVIKRIPHYKEMLACLVSVLPDKKDIKVVDLGTGSGTLPLLIKQRFPGARIRCVDMSPAMLETAKKKLAGHSGMEYEQADLSKYEFSGKYDAVVASLALHHLEPGSGKTAFYKKINSALVPGGMLAVADIMLASDERTQAVYIEKWQEFLSKGLSQQEIDENHQRYLREDRPARLRDELDSLKSAGFKNIDVFWKYFNFAVYGGWK